MGSWFSAVKCDAKSLLEGEQWFYRVGAGSWIDSPEGATRYEQTSRLLGVVQK